MGAEGLEVLVQNAGKTDVLAIPGPAVGPDDDLQTIIDAWPVLSELERQTILQMVATSSAGRKLD